MSKTDEEKRKKNEKTQIIKTEEKKNTKSIYKQYDKTQ